MSLHITTNLLAQAVRAHRESRGFSLGALAEKAGISKISLSKIEAGQGNPSLDVLCRIASAPTDCKKPVSQLGLRVGGQAGADAGSELGLSGSRDTILRLVRRCKQSTPSSPRVIGLDDWAYKRRLRYGTLICDLEQSRPIDLLPDRSVESVAAWLKQHPSIEVVSRDGSSEYASAIREGAPQARQVSDRWHLVKNLVACVSVQLARTLAQLRRAEERRPAQTQAIQQAQLVLSKGRSIA